jgi:hypothetical protein
LFGRKEGRKVWIVPAMLRLRVAQKPMLAVSAGRKTCQNWPGLAPEGPNWDEAASMAPKPPAWK